VAADDGDGHALRLFEDRREQISCLDRVAARPAGVQQGELEQQLGRRGDAQIAAGGARQQPQVLLERLEDLVGVQVEVAHHLAEHVPLDLSEGEADMLVREQRVLAPPRFVESPIDDALG
jgi:hypothetical protein